MEELINPFTITCALALIGGFFGAIGGRLGWYLAGKLVSG